MKKIILADSKLNHLVDEITAGMMASAQNKFETGAIDGADITTFSHNQQVNQFILFRIYQDWNAHVAQMVHPFFDFGDPEVKEGLRKFLNVLSGHIRVRQADFEPLVRQAIYNSLKLLLNAEDTLDRFFFMNTESIGIDVFRRYAPYFSSYDFVIQAILKYHEKNQLPQLERQVFFEKLERVIELWEGKEGKSIGDYQREQFLSLTGKELEDVVGREPVMEEIPTVQAEVESVMEEVPAEEVVAEEPVVTPEPEERKRPVIRIRPENIQRPEDRKEEQKAPERHEAQPTTPPWVETTPQEEEKTESRPSNLPPWVKEEVEESSKSVIAKSEPPKSEPKQEDKPRSLIEAIREGKQPSLVDRSSEKKDTGGSPKIEVRVRSNEPPKTEKEPEVERPAKQEQPRSLLGSSDQPQDFTNKEPRTLVDKFRQQSNPVADDDGGRTIKAEQIPVHKQFQYVQKVFGGSSVKFKVVLDKINKTETLEDANDVLDKYVFNDPNVNRNDKVSKEFEAMVRARFQR